MAAGGFKIFTTGEVLTAADTNNFLMQGVLVFADAAARDAAITTPVEGQVVYLKDTDQILSYDGSVYVAVGAGGGGGKVLQVVSSTTTTQTTIASTSLTDTTITATITPTSATSTILVFVNSATFVERSSRRAAGGGVLLRGATTLMDFNSNNLLQNDVGGGSSNTTKAAIGFHYLDSPATTSATTYKVQGKAENTADSGIIVFQNGSSPSTITLLEIGA